MGNILFRLFFSKYITSCYDRRVLFLGLDNAGKSTLLQKITGSTQVETTTPTIGFNVECMFVNKMQLTIWDCGGQEKIRPLWKHYFERAAIVVFVVDSTDQERLQEAGDEFGRLVVEGGKTYEYDYENEYFYPDQLKDSGFLVIANKQDLPNRLSVEKLANEMGLTKQMNILPCSALTGQGTKEIVNWMVAEIRRQWAPPPAAAAAQ